MNKKINIIFLLLIIILLHPFNSVKAKTNLTIENKIRQSAYLYEYYILDEKNFSFYKPKLNDIHLNDQYSTKDVLKDKIHYLYDLDNELCAYLLINDSRYIIIDLNLTPIESAEYGKSYEKVFNKVSTNEKLYYIFPFNIMDEHEKNTYKSTYTNNNILQERIENSYFKNKNFNELQSMYASSSNTDVRLLGEKNFIPIYGPRYRNGMDYQTWYGGRQHWLEGDWKVNQGCGPTALTNIISYLAMYNYPKFYDDGTGYIGNPTRYTDFANKLNGVYDKYLSPVIGGVFVPSSFMNALNDIARDKGYSNKLLAREIMGTSNRVNFTNAVIKALDSNQPFAIFIDKDGSNNNLDWHWITATKYFKLSSTGDEWIKISSWGEDMSIHFGKLMNFGSIPWGCYYDVINY